MDRIQTVQNWHAVEDDTAGCMVEMSCGHGSKGDRLYQWYITEINSPDGTGCKRHLLVRRSLSDSEDLRAYICYAPENTETSEFIRIAGTRWTVETCFAESKSEVGLDQYEVRSYDGWYKHITLACLTHAFLTVLQNRHQDILLVQCEDSELLTHTLPTKFSLADFKKKRGLFV